MPEATATESTTVEAPPNPYVGPQPFKAGQALFGRKREVLELRYLLTSERIVLLYSPSGAGKSSLVNAGLIPALEDDFEIWGPTRVNSHPPEGVANRYVWSAVSGILGQPAPPDITFARFLAEAKWKDNPLILFDQFEEVLRLSAVDLDAKREFFEQLGGMLRDLRIWALFIIREDYLAPLDPYARFLPTHLQNRYRIDRLDRASALEAIVSPTAHSPRKYAPGVAETLVANLAKVKVQNLDGTMAEGDGGYVEPLQLQVVCFDLWKRMQADDLSIDDADVGDISQALSNYYASVVKEAAGEDPIIERNIRDWFEEKLITKDGVRNQVRHEAKQSGGLDNVYIARLLDAYLIRPEPRGGVIWYELAHDRLVAPIRRNNEAWFVDNLNQVQRRVVQWLKEDRPESLLLIDSELEAARAWAAEIGPKIKEEESRFLAECGAAQQRADSKRREEKRRRILTRISFAVAAMALCLAAFAAYQYFELTGAKSDLLHAKEDAARLAQETEKAKANLRQVNLEARDTVRYVDELNRKAKEERDNLLLDTMKDIPLGNMLQPGAAGGEVRALAPGWMPLQRGPAGLNFSMVRSEGKGRILCVGHIASLSYEDSGSALFVKLALRWLDQHHSKRMVIVGGVDDTKLLKPHAESWGYTVTEDPTGRNFNAELLKDASVLVVTGSIPHPGPAELQLVSDFVSNGGGLIGAGYGWVWLQYGYPETIKDGVNRTDKQKMDMYPINELMQQFGVRWTREIWRMNLR